MNKSDICITFLGTGAAMPAVSFNACFVLDMPGLRMLVDAGGGNEILRYLDKAGIATASIHDFFITHTHTDHILGAVWVIRKIIAGAMSGSYAGSLNVYGNADVIAAVDTICRLTFLKSYYDYVAKTVNYIEVGDGAIEIGGHGFEFFDVGSENVKQTGFRVDSLAFLGDEGLTERNLEKVRGVDWLLCGAFCRYADRDIFKPYEKHHNTVLDIARLAREGGVGNLILFHSEDRNLDERQDLYATEGAGEFGGRIIVPRDLEVVNI